ncbi:hypothetical protein C8Q79DRAFT_900850 [Trametes meyenii]|nr:hypothetical protein C8Q79DRAFT_900850 [Trametes meyenii]
MSASLDVLPPRPSLLDRRASSNVPHLPGRLSVAALLAPQRPQSAPRSAFVHSPPRRPSAAYLPFVPLTPIMASPLLTPDVAHPPTPAAVLESAARQHVSAHIPTPSLQEQDYISHHTRAPNPTWTTSPPTPPPKLAAEPRAVASSPSSPARAVRGRTNSRNTSSRSTSTSASRSGPRPASLASYTPTPLSRSYSPSPSLTAPSSSPPAMRHATRRLSLPADLSKPLPPRPVTPDGAPTTLPPVPPAHSRSASIETAYEEALLPSLSRRAQPSQPAAGLVPGPGETTTLRGRARKLFSLADDEGEGDVSDTEDTRGRDAPPAEKRHARDASTRSEEDAAEEMVRGREQDKQRAERVRRYHALMELLTTEVGYLFDLRALVTVYLDQLLLLSSPSPAATLPPPLSGLPSPPLAPPLCLGVPVASSGRSMTSLSALAIPSLFPSSRSSSFFHASPCPSPSPSTTDFLAVPLPDKEVDDGRARHRTRQSSGESASTDGASRERDREREREKENLERIQPPKAGKSSRSAALVLTEKEVRTVYRNAQELLGFHERFVGELRAAVGLVGYGLMLDGDEDWIEEMRGEGEGVIADLVEHAVEVVATKFVNEAAAFRIYEVFCPGHAAATDLVRRAQERWPAIWDAYEQRCGLLIARGPDPSAHLHHRGGSAEAAASAVPTSPASDEGGDLGAEGLFRKKRRHSTPALAFARQFSATGSTLEMAELPGHLPFPPSAPRSAALPMSGAFPSEKLLRSAGPKLKFMDYLIKPVQRICKYPLLLDQLRPKRGGTDSVRQGAADEAVRRAGEAMRRVVSRVNHASEKEAHNLRSALIASRIVFTHSPVQPGASPAPSAYPPPTTPSSSSGSSSSHGHTSGGSSSASSCASSPATTVTLTSVTSSPGSTPLPPLTPPSPRAAGLTAEFVSSLGPCMLAGAFDVLQHPAHRAKYLGTFLYAGGYCILVKITKGGRVYEPRHWFPFGGVEVVDEDEDDPSFPYSFHVSAYGHHLQLGASCAQEKAIWLSAINDALRAKPSWVGEPLSSFQADDKSPLSAVDDTPLDSPSGLPTIQSITELEKHGAGTSTTTDITMAAATTPSGGKGQLKYSRTLSKLDSIALKQEQHSTFSAALSRRSSTASVKAFFSPISFDSSRVTRPSGQVRAQVEQGLHDIFSETCQAARSQAQIRGEELFQVRAPQSAGTMGKRQGSGIPRSNSGISIANAMGFTAARRRYDNRRKASMEGVPDLPAPGENAPPASATGAELGTGSGPGAATGPGFSGRAKTLAVRRQKKQPASIAPAITTAIAQLSADADIQKRGSFVRSPEALSLDSPPAVSHCSSASSHPGSVLPSPTEASPLPIPVPGLSPNGTLRQSDILQARPEHAKPKRARSMVSNVRNFFNQPRSDSLSVSTSFEPGRTSPAPPVLSESPSAEYPSGIVQWLRRTSIRRRESSSSGSRSTTDGHQESSRRPLPTRNSTDGVSGRNARAAAAAFPQISQSPKRVAFTESAPKRRRSLFVPSSRSRDRALAPRDDAPGEDPSFPPAALPSRRSIKSFLLFQRSNSHSPMG